MKPSTYRRVVTLKVDGEPGNIGGGTALRLAQEGMKVMAH